jgi:hypothetical protein
MDISGIFGGLLVLLILLGLGWIVVRVLRGGGSRSGNGASQAHFTNSIGPVGGDAALEERQRRWREQNGGR